MKLKRWLRRITFVVIPGADAKVAQLRLPLYLVYILPFLLLGFISGVTAHLVQQAHAREAAVLEQQRLSLIRETELQSREMQEKQKMIETLKAEIVGLAEQSEQMKAKMEELRRLEEDILGKPSASGAKTSSAADSRVTVASFGAGAAAAVRVGEESLSDGLSGIGGVLIPVSDEEILGVAERAKQQLAELDAEVESVAAGLQEAKKAVAEREWLSRTTPSLWPTVSRRVSSHYGYRSDPFTSQTTWHDGIDFAGPLNDPVVAAAEGKVVTAGWDAARGYNVVINHGNGFRTTYMHLNKLLVSEGDAVKKGERIGLLGSTGRSTGPHLHYTISRNGVTVDPRPYLKE